MKVKPEGVASEAMKWMRNWQRGVGERGVGEGEGGVEGADSQILVTIVGPPQRPICGLSSVDWEGKGGVDPA